MALRHGGALVLRTNLFGVSQTRTGASLVDFLVGKFRRREPVSLFTDVLFSPLHVKTVAALTVECVRRKLTGTFNLGSRDGMSKCDFAMAVAKHLGLPTENATPAPSTSLPARAPRPLDMRMDSSRIEHALGSKMPALIDEVKKL
jgi:dTDP-4-dehydrorhamnose reductase